ncbi:class I SAM-dependent methyltransferase [Mycobacterium szulgai]|uniref:class I SAM-dependent methyltransferase n=1 Tax=Mycobacterium szulgai TaxID=1787 RepID=UPI0021F2BEE0|nr:class I SAM-dependent methyltransferase [Mycobacterium szulgai]
MVSQTVTDPLNQRVLDPSCGSGTFLFYAVRRFLAAADASGVSLADAMAQVSSQVIGIDLHPVAVALARVTYLLALGRDRLNAANEAACRYRSTSVTHWAGISATICSPWTTW